MNILKSDFFNVCTGYIRRKKSILLKPKLIKHDIKNDNPKTYDAIFSYTN